MKYFYSLLFLSLVLIFSCKKDSSTGPQADTGHGLYFSPAEASLSVGQEIAMNVNLGSITDSLFAICFPLTYLDSVIQFVDSSGMQAGDFFGTGSVQFAYDSSSTIYATLSRTQGQEDVCGSGTLCTFRFKGKAVGTCPLTISATELHGYSSVGMEIEPLDIEITSATLHVQ